MTKQERKIEQIKREAFIRYDLGYGEIVFESSVLPSGDVVLQVSNNPEWYQPIICESYIITKRGAVK